MAGDRHIETAGWTRRGAIGQMALVGAGLAALSACSGEGQQLRLAIWQDYLGETTLEDFRKASGISVEVTTFTDNADLYDRMKRGGQGFDVIVPSSMWAERMIREDLLLALSHTRLPNLANLESGFADPPYDPGNAHSVPYTWMALGIGFRRSRLARPPLSWKELLEDPRFTGRLALPGDPALAMRIAGKAAGIPANSYDPAKIKTAESLLAAAMPGIKSLYRDGGQDQLLKDEVDAIAVWNGDLAQVALEDPDIAFTLPQDGALLTADCLCIPLASRRPGNAHRLIDFLLSAQGGASVAGRIWFPTPNEAARKLLPPDYNGNEVLFPPLPPRGSSEFVRDNPGLDAEFAAAMNRIGGPVG